MFATMSIILIVSAMGTALISLTWLLAKKTPSHVRMIWYLFSLSLVITTGMGLHAQHIGAIDESGKFKGEYGQLLEQLLKFMLDLNTDILLLCALLGVIVIPQLITYLLSGLVGCASAPLYTGRSMSFFVWGIIKSFSVCSGIMFSIFLMGAFNLFDIGNSSQAIYMAMLLIVVSFSMILAFEEGKTIINDAIENWPTLTIPLRRIHIICTRNQIAELPESHNKPEKSHIDPAVMRGDSQL